MSEKRQFDLTGRIALVTGASGGLGQHFAQVLARHGAKVVVTARRAEAIEQVTAGIIAAGGRALAIAMDVTSADSVAHAFDEASERVGIVDVLVNNSGVATTAGSIDLEESEWDRVLDTNLKGAWLTTRACCKRSIAASQAGSIINIASILADRAGSGVAPYCASKAGLAHLTRAQALELARHRIRVNAIAPGYIETEMNRGFFDTPAGEALLKRVPQRRLGLPEHLDGALLLLASDLSDYMTGSTIVVDGGHLQSSL